MCDFSNNLNVFGFISAILTLIVLVATNLAFLYFLIQKNARVKFKYAYFAYLKEICQDEYEKG